MQASAHIWFGAALFCCSCIAPNDYWVDPTTTSDSSTTPETSSGVTSEDSDATLPAGSCGDGNLAANEQCDDGNQVDLDGCNGDCKKEYCGDGVVNNFNPDDDVEDEFCDNGDSNQDENVCTSLCLPRPVLPQEFIPEEETPLFGKEGDSNIYANCDKAGYTAMRGNWETIEGVHELLNVTFDCVNVKAAPVNDGIFRIEPDGEPIPSTQIKTVPPKDGKPFKLECPQSQPFIIGIGGYTIGKVITTIEIHCVDLRIVPDYENTTYKLDIDFGVKLKAGDEETEQPTPSCKSLDQSVLYRINGHIAQQRIVGFGLGCGDVLFGEW